VAVGSLLAAVAHWPADGERAYRTVGTLYALAAGVALAATPGLTPVYRWTLVPALLWFGGLGVLAIALFVLLRVGARAVARRVVPRSVAEAVAEVAAAVGSTLALAWTVIETQERLVRTGVGGTLATLSLLADVLGYDVAVSLGLLEHAVDVPVVVFVGSVVVGFHTLASWDAAWRLARDATASGDAPDANDAADASRGR
ncbi:MAG: hypothetical protein ABEI80_06280, partial [Haloplanus sp.]